MVSHTLRVAAAMLVLVGLTSRSSQAQTSQAFRACYVTEVGALYLIALDGLPDSCLSEDHVEVSWTEGGVEIPDGAITTDQLADGAVTEAKLAADVVTGVNDHADLTGLENDDHRHYLLVNGARAATDGFAVTGSLNSGSIPVEDTGTRMMWYPGKAAFRAGTVTGDRWDDANVGEASVAFGTNTVASGGGSTAFGALTDASGLFATALGFSTSADGSSATALGAGTSASGSSALSTGNNTVASGSSSTAMGASARATGNVSFAIGNAVTASGTISTAMGNSASTNGFDGTFVYGDGSPGIVFAEAENSFVVRAQRVWFGKSGDQIATTGRYIETSTGAYLSDGGIWTNSSDAARKENFRPEDGERALRKITDMPIRSWNYRDEHPDVRHIGPTAQDFHAAFGLGDTAKAISTVDADGVALIAIQALEARTGNLGDMRDRIAQLEQDNASLRAMITEIRTQLNDLKALVMSH